MLFSFSSFVFKIGDLGHISSVENLRDIEEGDCRYLAPELLKDQEYKHSDLLSRADIFSLGITLFECASLLHIPKNSGEKDGDFFEQLQRGELPYLERYSRDFNELLKVC